ncbi:transposase [Ramlibacter alkalitolerans]|uniref:Transposase n=1 Tax=Ramlibacter alkalitolerans TaxID=2039631 RepID=A0ABS1JUQ2_9BURK|nr:transposase [Ramlibacter alkalitolerans]
MQNGYIESFSGKFRDECLNEHSLQTLTQTCAAIATWRSVSKTSGRTAGFGAFHQHGSRSSIASAVRR